MTLRLLFLGEGASDSGIAYHVERIATDAGFDVLLSDPDLSRLPMAPGRSVADKLRAVQGLGGVSDPVVIHRDGDAVGRMPRVAEIRAAIEAVMPGVRHVPVVPIRMTEAWLLLDEGLLRRVAGNPNGRARLPLPRSADVERVNDPKKVLREVLTIASGLTGRRLTQFQARFGSYRRQLLERLDPDGAIRDVPSWQHFVSDVSKAL